MYLESELGVKLFDRIGRKVALSEAGRRYAEHIKEVLAKLDAANRELTKLAGETRKILRVGVVDFAGLQEEIFDALNTLRKGLCLGTIMLQPMSSVLQIKAIESGDLDAGFIYNWPESSPCLDHVTILNDEWRIALPREHRLAERKSIRLSDLETENLVCVSPEIAPAMHSHLMRAFREHDFTPHFVQQAPNGGSFLALVGAGVGIGFLMGVRKPIERVVIRRLSDFTSRVPFDFVWNRELNHTGLAGAVRAMREAFGKCQSLQ